MPLKDNLQTNLHKPTGELMNKNRDFLLQTCAKGQITIIPRITINHEYNFDLSVII